MFSKIKLQGLIRRQQVNHMEVNSHNILHKPFNLIWDISSQIFIRAWWKNNKLSIKCMNWQVKWIAVWETKMMVSLMPKTHSLLASKIQKWIREVNRNLMISTIHTETKRNVSQVYINLHLHTRHLRKGFQMTKPNLLNKACNKLSN